MSSVSGAIENLETAILDLKDVRDNLLSNLAVLDNDAESAASMKEFLSNRIRELETIKTDISTNYEVAEAKRSALGL